MKHRAHEIVGWHTIELSTGRVNRLKSRNINDLPVISTIVCKSGVGLVAWRRQIGSSRLDSGGGVKSDFYTLADLLLTQSIDCSPAELHGCLSGQLCGGRAVNPALAISHLTDCYGFRSEGQLAAELASQWEAAQSGLVEGFDFHLLLPDVDEAIEQRVLELGAWCRGFLTGFAMAFSQAEIADSRREVPADTREALEDLAAIAQADVDADVSAEEAERELFEVTEYVRMAAISVFLEMAEQEEQVQSTPPDTSINTPSGLFSKKIH
jgi:uncharacterized protein YgfB (UPF0149 family)